jgi:hypothetical protein
VDLKAYERAKRGRARMHMTALEFSELSIDILLDGEQTLMSQGRACYDTKDQWAHL